MNEEKIINQTPMLRTRKSICNDLKILGLEEGMTVIVHSSLSSLGWVCGGPVAVIQALIDVVTPSGTIIMPAHSGEYSDPAYWGNPPVPQSWCPIIKETMPAYEMEITPTRGMGIIAETFRKWPGALRSSHPSVSFCAWGKNAEYITKKHSLDYSLAEDSPLGRIYELDGWVLLLGVGYGNNTSFHFAEYSAPDAIPCTAGAPIIENGKRVWKSYKDIEFDTDIFPYMGRAFEKRENVKAALVGSAESRLFKQRLAVDFAKQWLIDNRAQL